MALSKLSTMAGFTISLSPPLYPSRYHHSVLLPRSPSVRFSGELDRRRMRGLSVVTGAGPSSNQLIFAFVFPISLIAITVFTAFRIGDRLDEKFLEELAMNEAIRESDEFDKDDEDDVGMPRIEEAALPRIRNRPKREV